MRQILYSIAIVMGMALSLLSCADDHLPDDTGSEGNSSGTGDFLSLTMSLPLSTKSTSFTGYNMGIPSEVKVDAIRLVFYQGTTVFDYWDLTNLGITYDPATGNVDYSDVSIKDAKVDVASGNIVITTKAKDLLKPDSYQLLIIVNPNAGIKSITETGGLKADIETGQMDATTIAAMTNNPSSFLMLNHQGLINIGSTDFRASSDKAEANPVKGSVERTVAKIDSRYTPAPSSKSTEVAPYGRFVMLMDYNHQQSAPWGTDYDIPEDCLTCPICGGTFDRATKQCSNHPYIHSYDGLGLISDRVRYFVATDLAWQVDIVNNKSYWIRHLADKADAATTQTETQGDTDRQYFYAEDPNFTVADNADLNANFSYITSNTLFRKLTPPAYTYTNYWSWSEGDDDPVYIPENTMEKDAQTGNVVTRAIFKVALKREQFGSTATDEDPASMERIGDFFVFKGGDTNVANYKYNNYNTDGTTFFILRPEDVAVYAKAITASIYDENNVHPYLRDGLQTALEAFIAKYPSFDWTTLSANTEPAITDKLIFYKNSEMYYEVPIEHFSTTEAGGAGAYGRFGVVRNNWYHLNVEKIISIGQPVIPTPSSALIEKTSTKTSASEQQLRSQSIIF